MPLHPQTCAGGLCDYQLPARPAGSDSDLGGGGGCSSASASASFGSDTRGAGCCAARHDENGGGPHRSHDLCVHMGHLRCQTSSRVPGLPDSRLPGGPGWWSNMSKFGHRSPVLQSPWNVGLRSIARIDAYRTPPQHFAMLPQGRSRSSQPARTASVCLNTSCVWPKEAIASQFNLPAMLFKVYVICGDI